ncbi:MAG TPA: carboxypeptidase-like regulatory domain-containing protein [Longimicrobium sp.]|nr:carboxypeptidase-like regulatory domain-containing protein [Longimicrobium sp.]
MKRWTTFLLVCAAVAVSTGSAVAQGSAVLRGTVVDGGTGRPIPGAIVHVGPAELGVADMQGRFKVGHLVAGPYTVWATAMGYGVGSAEVEMPFDSMTVTLSLDPDPVKLEAIVATAGRFESRTRAYPRTVFVYREGQLRTAASANMRDFILFRGGLRRASCGGSLSTTCVRIRGQVRQVSVFIDEVYLAGGMDLLTTLRPHEVARVEVFNGGSEVRVYTKSFMEWAARTGYRPLPLGLGGR